jgi:hypothetical protein
MTILDRSAISRLSAGDLFRLYDLRTTERALLVEFLAYLGELDARKVYLGLGFSSTFAFCTDYLGLTRSSAFRRTTAARLLVRFPVAADYGRRGEGDRGESAATDRAARSAPSLAGARGPDGTGASARRARCA